MKTHDVAPRNATTDRNGIRHEGRPVTHRSVATAVAGIAVAGFGIAARTSSDYAQTAHVVKAGKLITVTSSDAQVVR